MWGFRRDEKSLDEVAFPRAYSSFRRLLCLALWPFAARVVLLFVQKRGDLEGAIRGRVIRAYSRGRAPHMTVRHTTAHLCLTSCIFPRFVRIQITPLQLHCATKGRASLAIYFFVFWLLLA